MYFSYVLIANFRMYFRIHAIDVVTKARASQIYTQS